MNIPTDIPAEILHWAADFYDEHLCTDEVAMVALAYMAGQLAAGKPTRSADLGVTTRQGDVLNFLRCAKSSPSTREIKDACGFASNSSVARVLDALQERGFIHRLPGRARSITITARA